MAKDSLKEKAYQLIKSKIISCEYKPASFLNETALMEEVGASRTPIREALNKLEQENLVKIIAKKCVMVSDLLVDEIGDVYQVRELIEPFIIRLWGKNISKEQLAQYKIDCQETRSEAGDHEKYVLDDAFHSMIIEVCQNTYLTQMMNHLHDQNLRIRVMSGCTSERLSKTVDEHLAVTDCLLANDYEGAAQKMIVHLENGKKAAFESLITRGK